MLALMEVLRGMLVFRRVTAANVSTNKAQPQMDPRVSGLNAFFADVLAGLAEFDLVEVRTLFWHLSSKACSEGRMRLWICQALKVT
jgi:hypothetical protein